jgi:hypothetical protein
MERKIKSLMTKKELELVQSGSVANVKFHSADRLKKYISLTRDLRDKYRDLARRQKVAQKHSQNERTMEKAQIFETVLDRYEKHYQEKKIQRPQDGVAYYDPVGDHTGHYDMDGVSQYRNTPRHRNKGLLR